MFYSDYEKMCDVCFEVNKAMQTKSEFIFSRKCFPYLGAKADLGWVLDGSPTPSLQDTPGGCQDRNVDCDIIPCSSSYAYLHTSPEKTYTFLFLTVTYIVEYLYIF